MELTHEKRLPHRCDTIFRFKIWIRKQRLAFLPDDKTQSNYESSKHKYTAIFVVNPIIA